MKILLIIHHLQHGGAQRQVLELARFLSRRGHSVTLAVLEEEQSATEKSGYRENYADIEVISCERNLLLQRFLVWLSRKRLGKSLLSSHGQEPFNPSPRVLIYGPINFLIRSVSATLRVVAAYLLGPRLLYPTNIPRKMELLKLLSQDPSILVHSLSLQSLVRQREFELAISFLSKTNCVAITALLKCKTPVVVSERNNYAIQNYRETLQRYRAQIYPQARVITANTRFAVEDIQKDFRSSEVLWLPNLFDYRGASIPRVNFVPNVCVVSRLEPAKNIQSTVEAFSLEPLRKRHASLDVIGTGSDRNRLQKIAFNQGLSSQVSFLGYIYQDQIPWAKYGIIVINGSGEGSSNALHEAVSRGLIPLVASAVREPWEEILSEDVLRHVGTDGSPQQIAEKLDGLLSNWRSAASLSREIQNQFETYWSESAIQMHKVIAQLEHYATPGARAGDVHG